MTLPELAALVSQTLEAAGIAATLSGGGAVSIFTENQYESDDLDFVTAASRRDLAAALAPLGFRLADDRRHFTHADTRFFLEFPPAPLQFGARQVRHEDIPLLQTAWGPVRVITPTLAVMDRLAAFWHWHDRQSWDQAVMIATHCALDFAALAEFAAGEGADRSDIAKLRARVGRQPKATPQGPRGGRSR
jgi:hypothetical protein